jgi:hypothetical protein
MKSITGTMTRSITTPKTLAASHASSTVAATSQSRGTSAFAAYAARSSGAIKPSPVDAAQNASGLSESAAPAYNLTVDVDECYFVRGDDGRAYLVSNSSHGSDAFGLMAVAYEAPRGRPKQIRYPEMGFV